MNLQTYVAAASTDVCHGTVQVPEPHTKPTTMTDTKELNNNLKMLMASIQVANVYT